MPARQFPAIAAAPSVAFARLPAEFNVRACLHEMASGTRYKRPTPIDDDPFGEPPSEEAEAEAEVEADGEERRPMRSVAPPEGVQVHGAR